MIPVTELHEFLRLELDKIGSPYFTDTELDVFLNSAIMETVRDIYSNFPIDRAANGQAKVGYEASSIVGSDLSTLVRQAIGTMTTFGFLSRTEIDAALGAGTYLYIISLEAESDGFRVPVRFLRNQEAPRFKKNFYLKPGDCNAYFMIRDDGLAILPNDVLFDYDLIVLAEPGKVNFNLPQDSDLPYQLKERVVAAAAKLASISMRDVEALTMVSAQAQEKP